MANPMGLPGGPIEICFSFDTTISMTSYVDQVKARLQDMVQRLKSDIPGIRIALFAHGDYYQPDFDNKNPYVTRFTDFTDDVPKLCKFIKESVPTTGGDWEECYELVMKQSREDLTWTPGTNKILVMIGDARPHPPKDYGVYFKEEKLNWREEAKSLLNKGIRSYGVYCNTPNSSGPDKRFFQDLSDIGKGSFLELKNFDSIFDFMMAICYREHGEDALFAYAAEVTGRSGGAAKDVHNMLTTLKKSVSNASAEGTSAAASSSTAKTRTQKRTAAKITNKTKALSKPVTAAKAKAKAVKTTSKTKPLSKPVTAAKAKAKKLRGGIAKAVAPLAAKPKGKPNVKTTESNVKATAKVNKGATNRSCLYKPKNKVIKKALPRLRRERVPETNFQLREFPWSSWKLVISSEERKNLVPTIQRIGKKDKVIEYSAIDIFNGKTKCPALYEFAVRPNLCKRKRVVYAKVSTGFSSYSKVWWKELFPSNSLRNQVDNIVRKQGGDIFVRRLILKKYTSYKSVPSTVKNYDYVWSPEDGAKKYRELKQDSYVISADMEVD